ncbi:MULTISPECIES: acetyl-CoA carboxylase biotin carboxyl carrier protein [unclassified Clostridium]|uniref:acetyl-CoA carboxylase biotin carboxyl carrier protein n=1 Tax=unclassified Clostridium TaxID=2614128 RepID=UPI00029834DA|nr:MULTISPECIES: acetyl-CoA carboxylase biotin carboxyl carrier protein [unclassified Clostridium]EKQ53774.1 MAG: acetyl-CoA carboxylase, biotin carboxyl carrier protein [Clostridium sp. Maddingley MBC34-26]
MDFEKIKELIKLVDSSSLAFFELQSNNDHIKMDKSLNRGLTDSSAAAVSVANNPINTSASAPVNSTIQSTKTANNVVEKEEVKNVVEEAIIDDKNINTITAPMVGTFYSSASPESSPFVEVGSTISKGKVICIIEAMKLMNEIESEYSGVIVERLVNDGDMVEYGQPLFKVKGE